jgi:hypothetical protein
MVYVVLVEAVVSFVFVHVEIQEIKLKTAKTPMAYEKYLVAILKSLALAARTPFLTM